MAFARDQGPNPAGQSCAADDGPGAKNSPPEQLKTTSQFERVYQTGRYLKGRLFSLVFRPNSGSVTRIGISAKPGNFPNMVSRNRFRRLIKELCRRELIKYLPAGYDIIFISGKQNKKKLTLEEVRKECLILFKKMSLR